MGKKTLNRDGQQFHFSSQTFEHNFKIRTYDAGNLSRRWKQAHSVTELNQLRDSPMIMCSPLAIQI